MRGLGVPGLPVAVAAVLAACSQRPAPEATSATGAPGAEPVDVRVSAAAPEAAATPPAAPSPDVPAAIDGDAGGGGDDDDDDSGTAEETAAPCSHVPGVCCVAVQPLGDPPAAEVQAVADRLREFYGVEVRVLDSADLPEAAYYRPRERWRAEKLLDFLRERVPEGCDLIAGVTSKDISTTKDDIDDWGILGLADLPGPAAVFSSFRCKRRVHDVPPLERLARVAVHEVGHAMGLPHCPTYGCFLEDAGGKAETIDRETFLCDPCRARLGWID